MALWCRLTRRSRRLNSILDDWILLALLLVIFVQGFLVEGLRIALTELHSEPALAPWSPAGYLVALALDGIDPERLRAFHAVQWWLHALTSLGFLAYAAYGKLAHAGYGALNILMRQLEPSGKLGYVDIEASLEADPESVDRLGVGQIERYSWKGLLDLDACMGCGRCDEVCPAQLSGAPLSPRKLIANLGEHLGRVGPGLLDPASQPMPQPDLVGNAAPVGTSPAVLEREVWGCRTCGACQSECPVYIEHVPKIVDLRRHLVMMEARMSEPAEDVLRSLDERRHPWGGAQRGREDWCADLDLKLLRHGTRAEWLLWVGCTGALVERNIEVSRALVKLLQTAGVDFAVLGDEEVCTGDPARRIGGELTFQSCAKQNIASFERYGVRRILTACPHCFNSLKHEYPDFGGRYQVVHHTQMIRDLVQAGRLVLGKSSDPVTYHDPCYLGRHNGVYAAPREILAAATAKGGLREPRRSRSRALCCGAGGGYAWMDDASPRRIQDLRYRELRESGARTVAVACPFCLQMFDDAAGSSDSADPPRVIDVAELAAETLEQ